MAKENPQELTVEFTELDKINIQNYFLKIQLEEERIKHLHAQIESAKLIKSLAERDLDIYKDNVLKSLKNDGYDITKIQAVDVDNGRVHFWGVLDNIKDNTGS